MCKTQSPKGELCLMHNYMITKSLTYVLMITLWAAELTCISSFILFFFYKVYKNITCTCCCCCCCRWWWGWCCCRKCCCCCRWWWGCCCCRKCCCCCRWWWRWCCRQCGCRWWGDDFDLVEVVIVSGRSTIFKNWIKPIDKTRS